MALRYASYLAIPVLASQFFSPFLPTSFANQPTLSSACSSQHNFSSKLCLNHIQTTISSVVPAYMHQDTSTPLAITGHGMRLDVGVSVLPHPAKVHKGGEDAYFVTSHSVGVADGVGGWAEYGVDPALYSRQLMANCATASEDLFKKSIELTPLEILKRAYSLVSHQGTSTACVVTISNGSLKTANLGDSGFLVVREGKLMHASTPQQKSFNCPFQLGTGSRDRPHNADLCELSIQLNDLIVLATDGLFDNMFTKQIVHLASETEKNVNELAFNIAKTAQLNSGSLTKLTPFAISARDYGLYHIGGKPDDITVLVCRVVDPDGDTDQHNDNSGPDQSVKRTRYSDEGSTQPRSKL